MINPIKQAYATSITTGSAEHKNKEVKTNQTQKTESSDRVSKIAQEIKNGSYKIDLNSTAKAIADSLL